MNNNSISKDQKGLISTIRRLVIFNSRINLTKRKNLFMAGPTRRNFSTAFNPQMRLILKCVAKLVTLEARGMSNAVIIRENGALLRNPWNNRSHHCHLFSRILLFLANPNKSQLRSWEWWSSQLRFGGDIDGTRAEKKVEETRFPFEIIVQIW